MAIQYKIDVERQLVFTQVTGLVTAQDIIGHFEAARREGFLPYAEFVDASTITSPTLSTGELWTAAMAVRKLISGENLGSRAVLVANDTIYGLTRIFTTLMSGYFPIDVFRDPVKAEAWLDDRHSAGQNGRP
jgi:hypothetical protein